MKLSIQNLGKINSAELALNNLTFSYALNNAVLPYALQIASKGYKKALAENPHLMKGLNVYRGDIRYKAVADAQNKPYKLIEF